MSSKLYLSIVLFFNVTMAFAVPVDKFTASIGLSIENSDNIYLSPTNRKSDNIFHEIFSANYTRNSPTVKTEFYLNADHRQYQNKSFSDHTIYSSMLGFDAILVKNRINWNVNNRFERVQTSTSALNLPTNQENTNSFSTGPTVVILRNARQSLNLRINYNKLNTQRSDIDSSGYTGMLNYSRNLTRTFSVKFDVSHKVKNFVNSVANTDYSRTDSTITFSKRMRLSELELTGGRSIIVRKGASNVDHSIFRAGYKYNHGNKASLSMNYSRELGDFTGLFSNTTNSSQLLPSVGSEIFLMEQANIAIKRNFDESSIEYHYAYFTTSYTNQALNTATKVSRLLYTDKISSALEFGLSGTYQINTYNISARRDTLAIYAGSLSKKISGMYDLAFRYQYIDRKSNIASFVYNERRMTVSGTYHF